MIKALPGSDMTDSKVLFSGHLKINITERVKKSKKIWKLMLFISNFVLEIIN
jgi:hypothetical protein